MNGERLKLMAEAGWFRDELETDPLQFEDDRGPTRSVVQFIGYGGRAGSFMEPAFIGRHQPAPITVRDFPMPLMVRIGQIVAKILRWMGR